MCHTGVHGSIAVLVVRGARDRPRCCAFWPCEVRGGFRRSDVVVVCLGKANRLL